MKLSELKKEVYSDKLKNPLWQKKRLAVMERDKFTCQKCTDKKTFLNVHHLKYSKGEPWEVPNENLITLCEHCHKQIERLSKEGIKFKDISVLKMEIKPDNGFTLFIKYLNGFQIVDLHQNGEEIDGLAFSKKEQRAVSEFLGNGQR